MKWQLFVGISSTNQIVIDWLPEGSTWGVVYELWEYFQWWRVKKSEMVYTGMVVVLYFIILETMLQLSIY